MKKKYTQVFQSAKNKEQYLKDGVSRDGWEKSYARLS